MKLVLSGFLVAICMASTPVKASNVLNLVPVAEQDQHVRYQKGIATIENTGVRVMPMREMDHGSLQFRIAVFNSTIKSFNFGIENIKIYQNANAIAVFTREQLESKAKSRAMWSQIGYAMLAGVAAAAQNNNTYATTYTPHGVYNTVISNPGLSTGQLASLAEGGGAIAGSQIGLQRTLDAIGDEIIQTTTIDTNSGYGGRIVLAKLKDLKSGDIVKLAIDTGGVIQNFSFTLQ